jgi:hypothetical protein
MEQGVLPGLEGFMGGEPGAGGQGGGPVDFAPNSEPPRQTIGSGTSSKAEGGFSPARDEALAAPKPKRARKRKTDAAQDAA